MFVGFLEVGFEVGFEVGERAFYLYFGQITAFG